MELGTKIKDARLRKGLTQSELGSLLGVQKSAVAKWECGTVVNIKRKILKQLADVLEIPPHELIANDWCSHTVGMTELHATILADEKLMGAVAEYYELNENDRERVRTFIHNLVVSK